MSTKVTVFYNRISKLSVISCVAILPLFGTACQSTKVQQKVVEVSDDGKGATLQLSRDSRSLLAVDVSEPAKAARSQLKARKDLTVALMNSIAELSLLAGEPKQAALEARALLKRDLKNTDAMKTLIKVSLAQNRAEEAVLISENAIAVQPRDADLHCLKGLAHFLAGDSLAARGAWKKALEINPAHVSAQMNLAALYYQNRNVAQAGTAFEKVLAVQPSNPDAMVGKALVMVVQGQAEAARTLLVEQLKKSPKSALVLYNLAIISKDRFQDFTGALDYTERYLALSKGDRKGTEKFIAQREELKILMARKQGPLTDSALREMAATRSQSVTPDSDGGSGSAGTEDSSTASAGQSKPTVAQASNPGSTSGARVAPRGQDNDPASTSARTLDVNTDDTSALEDAIK